MTTRPYELLARFDQQGNVAGVSVRTITSLNGRDYEGEPIPLADASDPAFTEFAEQFAASVVAERNGLQAQVEALEQSIAPKDTEIATLSDQVASLQAQLDALLNPPTPTSVSPAQIRVWLIQTAGPTILDQIDGLLDQIEDAATRKIAKIKWEYGITVLRNDPLVIQFANALGFNDEQMDAAFLAASQIQ